ncbi:MAG TPA: hypothetical protein VIQ02_02575 [Jiangellaceae bacterium]
MKLAHRRPLAALVTIVGLTLAATGCAGVRSQTQEWYEPADGVSTEAGDIGVRNALVVADEDGAVATVLATFANTGEEDELVEVHVGDRIATPTTGPVEIPEGGYARIGPDDDARIDVFGADVQPGEFVDVEFVFQEAPRAEVQALVQRAEGDYEAALDGAEEPTPSTF